MSSCVLESVRKGRLSIQGLCVELSTLVRGKSIAEQGLPLNYTRVGEYIKLWAVFHI